MIGIQFGKTENATHWIHWNPRKLSSLHMYHCFVTICGKSYIVDFTIMWVMTLIFVVVRKQFVIIVYDFMWVTCPI